MKLSAKAKKREAVVWHYCYSNNIVAILHSQQLLPPCMTGVPLAGEDTKWENHPQLKADARMLLFSENNVWEPTSFRGIHINGQTVDLHNRSDYAKFGLNIYRVGVETCHLLHYNKLVHLAGLSNKMNASLRKDARACGSDPNRWWGTLKPVPASQWNAVEILVDGVWKSFATEAK